MFIYLTGNIQVSVYVIRDNAIDMQEGITLIRGQKI